MTPFDTIVTVDWSASATAPKTGRADAIWAAVARHGAVEPATYLGHRLDAEVWLADLVTAEHAAGRRVLMGFDFPFGFPAGFARALTGRGDPFAVWDWLEARIEDDRRGNNRFDVAGAINAAFPGVGPFWGNGLRRDIDHLPRLGRDRTDHGMTERRAVDARNPRAFPVWQLSGAGAVGSQVLMGLPVLNRLRRRFAGAAAVWPFQRPETPLVLAEIWPSLLDAAVRDELARHGGIKDARQVEVLARALAGLDPAAWHEMLAVDAPEEGWILGSGHVGALNRAARGEATRSSPPPLRNDCFALPPGIAWTPVDTALQRLREGLHTRMPVESVPLAEAAGRILSRPVDARRSVPPAANAAVDGYGFAHAHAVDGAGGRPGTLPLAAGRAAAGDPYPGAVPSGQAVRILTGAILPQGVDTVILQEDVTATAIEIAFERLPRPGANTRRAGEDVDAGQPLLSGGRRLTPADLAHLASAGIDEVPVHRRLRVGVLSTGSELAAPAAATRPEQTVDANRPMLLAMLARWGIAAVDLGLVPDDRADLRRRLTGAAGKVDAILTSGGASAGDEDHMSALLAAEGSLGTWRIAIKPGRPLALGLWQGCPVFGLPGNPVAAFVCTLIFARPALSVLAGGGWLEAQGWTVPAAFAKSKKAGRREYLRARLTPEGRAEVFASEGSGRISGLSWADGLVELPDAACDVAPGDPVRFLPFSGFGL